MDQMGGGMQQMGQDVGQAAGQVAQGIGQGVGNVFDYVKNFVQPPQQAIQPPAPVSQPQPIPTSSIRTEGNQIIDTNTNQPVTMRGAVSDYFRNSGFSHGDLNSLIDHVNRLKPSGLNTMGLYISDPAFLKSKQGELDKFIQYTKDNGIYTYLMPVARDFPADMYDTSKVTPAQIKQYPYLQTRGGLDKLVGDLSSRYKDNPNVLYGFGAENDSTNWQYWKDKQQQLAGIVRKNNPNAVVVVTPSNFPDWNNQAIPNPISNPINLKNAIYATDEYTGEKQMASIDYKKKMNALTSPELNKNYPVLSAEFGGSASGSDFSSPQDLAIIKDQLNNIQKANKNFTSYKLDADTSGLNMFDENNNLTPRGKLYSQYMATPAASIKVPQVNWSPPSQTSSPLYPQNAFAN